MAEGAPILEMRGIGKRFPGVLALRDVDISVRQGEVHGLVGENGAGKSTLMKILSGAYQADSGRYQGSRAENGGNGRIRSCMHRTRHCGDLSGE